MPSATVTRNTTDFLDENGRDVEDGVSYRIVLKNSQAGRTGTVHVSDTEKCDRI
ncbi:hypothetical protein BT69DRAFT_1344612 [Atractiella rhizophila]|nr:hypothetical protein BT69DRAFT_1344612 [Atractiella rhizophila]